MRQLYDEREIKNSGKIFPQGEKIFITPCAARSYGGTIFATASGTRVKCQFCQ
jgi:hypothetical protein